MKSVTIGNTPTKILDAPSGARSLAYLVNNSSQTVFLVFDGTDPSTLTTANGLPLFPNQALALVNSLAANLSNITFTAAIYGIVASGSADVRVQST